MAVATAVPLTLLNGGEGHHPAPHHVRVAGQESGVYAVAGFNTLDSPLSEAGARLAQHAGSPLLEKLSDQQAVSDAAWEMAVRLVERGGRHVDRDARPELDIAATWVGRSTALAYAIAYLDSEPLNPTPGSLLAGRSIAATGVASGDLITRVTAVDGKVGAAIEASATVLIVPRFNAREVSRLLQERDDDALLRIVAVDSLADAARWMCQGDGSGWVCDHLPPADMGDASPGFFEELRDLLSEEAAGLPRVQ